MIADIYEEALEKLGGDDIPLKFGPAHIVWEDENFDSADWCLEHFDEHRGDYTEADLVVVRDSLERLVNVPDELKMPPTGYDGENPGLFPPPSDWECVKV